MRVYQFRHPGTQVVATAATEAAPMLDRARPDRASRALRVTLVGAAQGPLAG